jgi:outer membrane protein
MQRQRGRALIALAFSGLIGAAGTARAEVKIGFINSEKILEQSKEARAALDGFQRDVDGWNQEAQQRRKDLDDLTRELGQQSPMLSDEKRREKEQDLQRKLTEYDQFVQSVWGPGGLVIRRNEEVLRPVTSKIQTILDKIGAEEGYDLILDAADGNILYADQELDLTDAVISQLNVEQ